MTTSSVKKVKIRIGDTHREITLHPPRVGSNLFEPLISTLPYDQEMHLENGAKIKLRSRRGIVKTAEHGERPIDATEISASLEGKRIVLVSDGRETTLRGVGITHKLVRVTHGNDQVLVKPLATHPQHEDIVTDAQIKVPWNLVKKHVRGCMVQIGEREVVVSGESLFYVPTIKAEVAQMIREAFEPLDIAVRVVYDASQGTQGHKIELLRANE
jgi:hypothetical protein